MSETIVSIQEHAQPLKLERFLAQNQAAGRWLTDLRSAFVASKIPAKFPLDQFDDILLWLAVFGIVPVVDAGKPKPFVPNFSAGAVAVRPDTHAPGGRVTLAYEHTDVDGTATTHAVVMWIPPIVDDAVVRYMTPLHVMYEAYAQAVQRYGAVEYSAAQRLNMPLMFQEPPMSGIAGVGSTSVTDIVDPNPVLLERNVVIHRVTTGTHVPYSPGSAPAVLHRLYHGATYRHVRSALLRPDELLAPFGAAHANGIADAARRAFVMLGHAKVRLVPSRLSSRKRAAPAERDESSSEDSSEDSDGNE